MAYCTITDIKAKIDEEELISLTDDYDSGQVYTPTVDDAVAGADSLIDTYLGGRYTVPLAEPVSPVVKKMAVDIAIYEMFTRRGRVEDAVVERYKETVRLLKDLSKGDAVLTGAASAPAGRSDDGVTITTSPRIFSRDKLKGW